MADYLALKWGTLKGWNVESEGFKKAFQAYADCGNHSASAMMQEDSDDQRRLLCEMIDAVDGRIYNDWSGEDMTKEEAKKYVMEYRR